MRFVQFNVMWSLLFPLWILFYILILFITATTLILSFTLIIHVIVLIGIIPQFFWSFSFTSPVGPLYICSWMSFCHFKFNVLKIIAVTLPPAKPKQTKNLMSKQIFFPSSFHNCISDVIFILFFYDLKP